MKKKRKGLSCSEAGRLGAVASEKYQKETKLKRIEVYSQNPKKCEFCEIELEYNRRHNKFCSQSCGGKKNGIGRRQHGNPPANCKMCGNKTISCVKKYCSNECYLIDIRNRSVEKILSGKMNSPQILRNYLFENRGYKCEICQNNIWMGKSIPLELDHIDGNHKNNKLNNLRILCCNCHAQTPTYKSKNNGNGRSKRRKRYKEGKSY